MKKHLRMLIAAGIVIIAGACIAFLMPRERSVFFEKREAGDAEEIEVDGIPNLHEKTILFEAEAGGKGALVISEADGMPYMSSTIRITENELSAEHTEMETIHDYFAAHGLTIKGKIAISIRQKADRKAEITLKTDNGEYSTEIPYYGRGGVVRVKNEEGTFSNARLRVECPAYQDKIRAYGDSYFDKWVPYAVQDGVKDVMWNGYSGRTSAQALASFEEDLKYGKPEKVLWCMGMNDPDEGDSVNGDWLKAYDAVRQVCKEKGIEFIPATIPNVPQRDHRAKNRIIRESGYRYIDISKAVGADERAEWDEGLLWPDQTHPSEKGSMVIAETVLDALKTPAHSNTD